MDHNDLRASVLRLDAFARQSGFIVPPARYISGSFNIPLHDGKRHYSDEAHLWCDDCARRVHLKALALLGPSAEEAHIVCTADSSSGEDTPAHCANCGEVLDHILTRHGSEEELASYEDHPSADISPREAFVIARVVESALWNPELTARASRLAAVSLEHIESNRIRITPEV